MSGLRRELGVLDALLLIAGSVIGAGVFLAPGLVAQRLNSGPWILAAWGGAGLLSLLGALVFAELGAMFPATGGQYVYLREAFGSRAAFLFGWSCLLSIYSAAIAWISVSFSIWLGQFIELSAGMRQAAAVALIAACAAINTAGVRTGARTQDVLTLLKLVSIAGVIVVAFTAPPVTAPPPGPVTPAAFGFALIGCLLSYDGWSNAGLMAGEMKRPQRDLPRALFGGVALIMLAYMLVNIAYLRLLTPQDIAGADRVASLAMQRAGGPAGGDWVAAAIVLSCAGSCAAWMLSAPRIYFAMAQDGCFFSFFRRLHPRFETPANAIALQAFIASVLVLTGTFESLASYAMFSSWLFYALAAIGLMRLRIKRPDAPRPFRVPLYPLTPVLFLLASGAFLVNTLVGSPRLALITLLLVAAGLPIYRLWSKSNG